MSALASLVALKVVSMINFSAACGGCNVSSVAFRLSDCAYAKILLAILKLSYFSQGLPWCQNTYVSVPASFNIWYPFLCTKTLWFDFDLTYFSSWPETDSSTKDYWTIHCLKNWVFPVKWKYLYVWYIYIYIYTQIQRCTIRKIAFMRNGSKSLELRWLYIHILPVVSFNIYIYIYVYTW